jgi:hypothetical protein
MRKTETVSLVSWMATVEKEVRTGPSASRIRGVN